jgi:hypothetical protein
MNLMVTGRAARGSHLGSERVIGHILNEGPSEGDGDSKP